MTIIKSETISITDKIPSDSTLDEIMEELYFKAQVDTGLMQFDEGNYIPQDDVKQKISKWIKK
jgi:predicted transcriptional regulator